MAETTEVVGARHSVSEKGARQLSNTTKTPPQMLSITPRWLAGLLPWVPVEAGTYRVNRVVEAPAELECNPHEEIDLPETFVQYQETPREYPMQAVTTIVDVNTRVSDVYRSPYDQIREQLRLTIEKVKERQEGEIVNNAEYGLLNNAAPAMRVKTRRGAPTPDDFDELISLVWKEPAYFFAHPRAIAAFGRECTYRGVPPPTVTVFGSPFLTWRGIPIIPTDKLYVNGGKTNVLLMRVGEQKRGVIGLFEPGLPGEVSPSLSVRFMGINRRAIASYLISLYCSTVVLVEDALGVLENVDVGAYHEYK